jgi:hypothetical protein
VGYDLDLELATDSATATFDRFDLAVPLDTRVQATAQFRRTGEPIPWEVSACWDTGQPPSPAADAVWTGSIVVRTATANDAIVAVTSTVDNQDITSTVQMSPPGDDPAPGPVALPVVVAFLVAGATVTPQELLRSTASARRGAARYAVAGAPAGAPARRFDHLVCWAVPDVTFDDPGWPGGHSDTPPEQQRADRLLAARSWLAGQGIALITTPEQT